MPHQGSPFMLPDYTSGVPRVHHHLSWTGFNGLPFMTPLRSEENTFFMSTHKLCLVPFSRAQSLSHLAMRPFLTDSHVYRNDSGLNQCISPRVSLQLLHLSHPFGHTAFCFLIIEREKKRDNLNPCAFSGLSQLCPELILPFRPESALTQREKAQTARL